MDRRTCSLFTPALDTGHRSQSTALLVTETNDGVVSEAYGDEDGFSFFQNDPHEIRQPSPASPRLLRLPSSSPPTIFLPRKNPTCKSAISREKTSHESDKGALPEKQTWRHRRNASHLLHEPPQDQLESSGNLLTIKSRPASTSHKKDFLCSSAHCSHLRPSRPRGLLAEMEHEGKECIPRSITSFERSFSTSLSGPRCSASNLAVSQEPSPTAAWNCATRCARPPGGAGLKKSFSVNNAASSVSAAHMKGEDVPRSVVNLKCQVNVKSGHPSERTRSSGQRQPHRNLSGLFPALDSDESPPYGRSSCDCCPCEMQAGMPKASGCARRLAELYPTDSPFSSSNSCRDSICCNSCRNTTNRVPASFCKDSFCPMKNRNSGTSKANLNFHAFHYARARQVDSSELARKTFLPYRTSLLGC